MEILEYKTIFQNESRHFFYLANHKIILSLIKKYFRNRQDLKILDAGCGTGLLAKKMRGVGEVVGIDISEHAIKYAKSRGINVKKASILNLPFKENSFDLVSSIDVLYHLKVTDDKKALREFFRVLNPGGLVIIRVPAHNWLRRSCDKHIHTRQRYNSLEVESKLKEAGFKIVKISYVNALLFPAALLNFLWEKVFTSKNSHTPLFQLPKSINSFIAFLLEIEIFFLLRFNLPVGLGIVAVARKGKIKS